MTAKCCEYAGKITRPICNAVAKFERRSQIKKAALDGPIAEYIAQHEAAGTDAARASTRRFVQEQKQLVHYRVTRFFDEARVIASGEYFKNYNYKNFIIDLRTLTKVLALYLAVYCIARRSAYPLITPDSPFALALKYKTNPNF